MEDEGDEAERREVHHEGRAPALFEEDVEADEQVDDADQVDVDVARGPAALGHDVFEVGVVEARLFGMRRALDEVAYVPGGLRVFEEDLHVGGALDLHVFEFVEADGEQAVARQHAEDPFAPGAPAPVTRLRDAPAFARDTIDAVGRRRGVGEALREVERAGGGEHGRRDQQHPSPRCQHRAFHPLTN